MLALQLALDALLLSRSSLRPALACCLLGIPATCTTTVTGALLTPGCPYRCHEAAPSLTASGRTAPEVELPRMAKRDKRKPRYCAN